MNLESQNTRANEKSREILREMFRVYKGRNLLLKKEYVRIKVIRGHKRAIRQIFNGKVPTKTLHSFDMHDRRACSTWQQLNEVCLAHSDLLNEVSQTQNGPVTDGKAKRAHSQPVEKSFNNEFCRWYFSFPEVRESYFFYIEHLFYSIDPRRLCKKLDVLCCDQDEHTEDCVLKWEKLKLFYTNLMLEELDIQAYQKHEVIEPRFFTKAVQTDLTAF